MNDSNRINLEETVSVSRTFNPSVARDVGTDAAIILQNIQFWVAHEEALENKDKFIDGRYWTYNSATAFQKLFTWLSPKQIQRNLKKLEDNKYIIVGVYNKHKYDKTKWYSLGEKYEKGLIQHIGRNRAMDWTLSGNGLDTFEQPIPYIKHKSKTADETNNGQNAPHQSQLDAPSHFDSDTHPVLADIGFTNRVNSSGKVGLPTNSFQPNPNQTIVVNKDRKGSLAHQHPSEPTRLKKAHSIQSANEHNLYSAKRLVSKRVGNSDSLFGFGYYLTCYEGYKKQQHPPLKEEQVRNALEQLTKWRLDWRTVIPMYFEKPLVTDYNINHFVTDGVLQHLEYESR